MTECDCLFKSPQYYYLFTNN